MRGALFPRKTEVALVLDFDGTLTESDVFDDLVRGFSQDSAWAEAEREWVQGLISSDECMSRQIQSVRASRKAFDAFLGAVRIDPSFASLRELADQLAIPMVILSDGFDLLIRKILGFHQIAPVPFRANHLHQKRARFYPRFPYKRQARRFGCSSCGHCKGATLSAHRRRVGHFVYVGDGLSDRCVLQVADTIFAKGDLARLCEDSHRDYHGYHTLKDVAAKLSEMAFSRRRDVYEDLAAAAQG